jgi:hypothetical protein
MCAEDSALYIATMLEEVRGRAGLAKGKKRREWIGCIRKNAVAACLVARFVGSDDQSVVGQCAVCVPVLLLLCVLLGEEMRTAQVRLASTLSARTVGFC